MVSATVHAEDVPIVKLKPLSERKISRREYERIKASIEAVGLIEQLIVSPENGSFLILDGVQRYRILLDLGVEEVPCILRQEKETFTCNRMVNHISPIQESRMIEKSLEELDEQTIASALGLSTIVHRLSKTLISQLHQAVAETLDAGSITRACAREFTYAKPERQLDILTMMKAHNDFSIAFARALILKTPPKLRARKRRNSSNPWNRAERKKNELHLAEKISAVVGGRVHVAYQSAPKADEVPPPTEPQRLDRDTDREARLRHYRQKDPALDAVADALDLELLE